MPVRSMMPQLSLDSDSPKLTSDSPRSKQDAQLNFGGITIVPVLPMNPYFPPTPTTQRPSWNETSRNSFFLIITMVLRTFYFVQITHSDSTKRNNNYAPISWTCSDSVKNSRRGMHANAPARWCRGWCRCICIRPTQSNSRMS